MSNDFLHIKPSTQAQGGKRLAAGPLRRAPIPRPRRIRSEEKNETTTTPDEDVRLLITEEDYSPRKKRTSRCCGGRSAPPLRDIITYINFLGVVALAIALGILAQRGQVAMAKNEDGSLSIAKAAVAASHITFTLASKFSISTEQVGLDDLRAGRVHYEVCCSLREQHEYICNDFTRFSAAFAADGKEFLVRAVDEGVVGSTCHLLIDVKG